jgi:hypothetical protein
MSMFNPSKNKINVPLFFWCLSLQAVIYFQGLTKKNCIVTKTAPPRVENITLSRTKLHPITNSFIPYQYF